MSESTFEIISKTLFPTAELVDLRGWGESLILPNIVKRIEQTAAFGCAVRIVTNLSFSRDEVLESLMDANAIVDISLDTSNREVLDVVRKGTNLDLVAKNLSTLTANPKMRERLTVLVTVQNQVVPHLPELMEFLGNHGVRKVRLFAVTSEQTSSAQLDQENDLIDTKLEQMKKVLVKYGMQATAGTRLGNMPANSSDHPACSHPWKYCNIAYDGALGFCDHLIGPGNSEYFVGNILESDFASIWNSDQMINLRKEHLGARRPIAPKFAHCAWCYKNKFIDFEERFDPELAAQVKWI
jgi:radical SAM protein with 4Fe4S-binding SPASM domain